MQLPKYHETYIPILKVLSNEKEIHLGEMKKRVRDEFYSNLPEELLKEKSQTGALIIMNRIGWGKAYLKQAKMLEQPERGLVKITKKGLEVLKKGNITQETVAKDSDFLEHRKMIRDQKKEDEEILVVDKNSTPEDMMNSGFELIENQVKSDLLERLKETDPFYFERVILILFKKMGYGDFIETSKTNDGGIDGVINQDQLGVEKIYTQAKRYTNNQVGAKEMTNFIGAISRDGVSKGLLVTTSSFSKTAESTAEKCRDHIVLIDGVKLVDLMVNFNVGVQTKTVYEIKKIDEDFFEEN